MKQITQENLIKIIQEWRDTAEQDCIRHAGRWDRETFNAVRAAGRMSALNQVLDALRTYEVIKL